MRHSGIAVVSVLPAIIVKLGTECCVKQFKKMSLYIFPVHLNIHIPQNLTGPQDMRKRVIQTSFYLIQNTDLLCELLP
jgi:hypothetical protein